MLSDILHHRVHRVAMATFWRTFHHDGKISHGGVGGVQDPPFTISTITYKVVVYAPVERADVHTPPISTLPLYVLCVLRQVKMLRMRTSSRLTDAIESLLSSILLFLIQKSTKTVLFFIILRRERTS
jgi:hypothetical protein